MPIERHMMCAISPGEDTCQVNIDLSIDNNIASTYQLFLFLTYYCNTKRMTVEVRWLSRQLLEPGFKPESSAGEEVIQRFECC